MSAGYKPSQPRPPDDRPLPVQVGRALLVGLFGLALPEEPEEVPDRER